MSSRETSSDEDTARPLPPSPPRLHEPPTGSDSRPPAANGAGSSGSAEPQPLPAPDAHPKTRHSSSSSGDAEPAPRRSKRLRRSSSAGGGPADEAGGGSQAAPPLVRRRLFGPVEPGSVERARQQHEQDVLRAQTERWNYDFFEDRPLPGRWQWQRSARSRSRPDSPGAGPAADQP